MFRKVFATATVLAAVFAMSSPAAGADYPEPVDTQVQLDFDSCTFGGAVIDFRARAMAGKEAPAGTMTVVAFGKEYSDSDNDLNGSAKSPKVTKRETFTITATFTPAADSGAATTTPQSSASDVTPASFVATTTTAGVASAEFRKSTTSKTLTLVPRSASCESGSVSPVSALLPFTGGPTLWYLIIGGGLLVAGGGAVMASRRRGN